MEQMHSLLKRQLKKYFGAEHRIPDESKGFIEAVNAAYKEFDSDRTMLERSLDLSSQELLQANSEMRAIFQAIPDLLFRFDYAGTILDCKASSTADLFRSPEDLIGRRIQDVSPQEVGQRFARAIDQVSMTKLMVSFEYWMMMHGRQNFYEARLLPLLENQLIAIIRNITTRKLADEALRESEEKYRTLIENINVGIYRNTGDFFGHFLQANPAMAKIFGYDSVDEFMGIVVADLYQDPAERVLFVREITKNGFVKDKELHLRKKDGTPITASCTATVQYDAQGNMKWIDGVLEDITERKHSEEELVKTSKLESIGILAGGIAHDFNNILTAIIGNISLAKMRADLDSDIFKRLSEAEKAALRAQDLTQQLLTFSKGGAPLKKLTSIADLLKESASFVMTGSNVRCEFDLPDNLAHVDIDEGQISQVINNLVINAKQAMPQGGTIHIKAENLAVGGKSGEQGLPLRDGDYVRITIRDQGSGIPEEYLDKIFDPYFTTKERGSGLGLTTTYAIIKKHDGHITVRSKFGKGTVFGIYLPASKERLVPVDEAETKFIKCKGNVLLMDDEEIVRDVAGDMLIYLGYDVVLASDGKEAVEVVRKAVEAGSPFDAVIMDLTIPGGMGGGEAIRKILEIDPKVKAVASSGYSNDPIMAEYEKYGFSAIVPKPYKIEDIRATLQQVINKAR